MGTPATSIKFVHVGTKRPQVCTQDFAIVENETLLSGSLYAKKRNNNVIDKFGGPIIQI